ncbi:hypothetical protein Tco_0810217 [Tanacetum coccineum]
MAGLTGFGFESYDFCCRLPFETLLPIMMYLRALSADGVEICLISLRFMKLFLDDRSFTGHLFEITFRESRNPGRNRLALVLRKADVFLYDHGVYSADSSSLSVFFTFVLSDIFEMLTRFADSCECSEGVERLLSKFTLNVSDDVKCRHERSWIECWLDLCVMIDILDEGGSEDGGRGIAVKHSMREEGKRRTKGEGRAEKEGKRERERMIRWEER